MQNKKSQSMVPILIGIVLIAAVFCVGFMTEKEGKITGAVSGMEGVSGMATLSADEKAKFNSVYAKYPNIPRGTLEGLYAAESTYGTNTDHATTETSKGPLGISDDVYEQYNNKGQYDRTTLEGSLEIAAAYINAKIITQPEYDSSASDEVKANQIQVAYNRGPGKMPTSESVSDVLDGKEAPSSLYEGTDFDPDGRFKNFEEGFNQGSACFLPTTTITLADGNKKQIQNIEVGDKVLSYDLENKKQVESEVLNVYSHEENEYLIISLNPKDSKGLENSKNFQSNDKIKVTPYHYVYAKRLKQ